MMMRLQFVVYVVDRYSVRVVKSWRAGVGKTLCCQKYTERLKAANSTGQLCWHSAAGGHC
jgi:hypothetical protein